MSAPTTRTAHANYYGNPFWTDWFDPEDDRDAKRAAACFARSSELRSRQQSDTVLATIGWLAAGVFLPIIALAQGSPNSSTIVFWFIVLLLSPVAAAVFVWVRGLPHRRSLAEYEGLLERTHEGSWGRYQCWLHGLAQADPHLYTQVMTWHQQQETHRELRRLASIHEANARWSGLLVLLTAAHLGQHHR